MIDDGSRVSWRNIIRYHKARPRAVVCLWLACHKRLATEVRLAGLALLQGQDKRYCLCKQNDEDIDHLFFQCPVTLPIWSHILEWLEFWHRPQKWVEELVWLIDITRRKGWKISLLKIAIVETVYSIWSLRNRICFDNIDNTYGIEDSIKDSIVYIGCQHMKCRSHLVKLML
ncbi:uncharacterized protein LOC131597522 [Vicia villosa]|uniref:uncharacterized protein LOC131597522 n=1 Tax=Vicia villosa TaxID=3911 RepID=UPI00273C3C65|nr:uncharacterized protein LOC131597522 [Vicia villosa]